MLKPSNMLTMWQAVAKIFNKKIFINQRDGEKILVVSKLEKQRNNKNKNLCLSHLLTLSSKR